MIIIISILLFMIALYIWVQHDYSKWLKNKSINHSKELLYKGISLIPSMLCLLLPINNYNFLLILAKFLVILGFLGSLWWELFDGWYNKMRNFAWRFTGSNDKNDAKLDNFLQKLTPVQIGLLKIGLITIFTISYIIIKLVFN